ncbi:PepSY-like domain-containing protein [Nonlabens ulvanivorans]|uniref:PepSY-like domain-containing protein n=1 Tax=Nonlabens ulvanivorans TaxID=906888 RepID=UPI002943BEC4|nr:PepSY-like domain-containing protein [Nonlabens ulvanivorans]WOI23737.1 PepSY-like domain-containing protein [Nonlabens ulvanivorans]
MKITILSLLILFISTTASCQEKSDKVPQEVINAFQTKYPGENDPDFELDDHGYWEAHFKKDGEKYRADFHADGTWRETENSIKDSEIPKAIQEAIEREFPDKKITEAEHVISATQGEFYDIEFEQKGKNMDVMYRKDGTKV